MKNPLLLSIALVVSINGALAEDSAKKLAKVKLTQQQAESIALKEVPGKVMQSEVEHRDKIWVWEIDIQPDQGRRWKEVRMNGDTGAVVRIHEHDPDD